MKYNTRLVLKYSILAVGSLVSIYLVVRFESFLFLLIVIPLALAIFEETLQRFINTLRGWWGERIVKCILRGLPRYFKFLSNIDLTGKGNIDFIVVGPTGVFTIEVKSHNGLIGFDGQELTVNGQLFEKYCPTKQAYAEALAVQGAIRNKLGRELEIMPVVVFSSSSTDVNFGLNKKNGVYVIGVRWLKKLLNEVSNTRLESEGTNSIVQALKDTDRQIHSNIYFIW